MSKTISRLPQIQVEVTPFQVQPTAQEAEVKPAQTRGQLRREIALAAHRRATTIKEANELEAFLDFDE